MNLTFDKALLWLIPYLYLISIIYYWGYWGTFDIDVFNYYAVSDLVKGVISPLRVVLSSVLIGVLAIAGMEWLSAVLKGKSNTTILLVSMGSVIPVTAFILGGQHFITGAHPEATHSEGLLLYLFLTTIWYFVAARLTTKYYGHISDAYNSGRLASFLSCFLLLVFPSRVYFNAKNEALLTLQNKEFNYIIKEGLTVNKKEIYKYLGKVGDYHILLTRDNHKSIIVPTNALSPLILQKVSLSDSASITRYASNKKALLVDQPH